MSSTDVLIYVDVISNKQSIFSSRIRTPSFPINWPSLWPSLASIALSPIILWRLWSYKPSHKRDSNKHQSKAFVICDLKSDEAISVTHVNKAYLVWLMFRVLSSQHYQHRTNQKLRSWANAVFQNRGVCGQAFSSFLSPSPVIPFGFCSSPCNFLDELARKRLLRRLFVFWNAWTALMVKSQWIRTINAGQSSARQNDLPFSLRHRQLECSCKSISEQSWPGNWWS